MKVKYARSDCKCPDMIYAFEKHYGKPFDTTAMRAEAECWERAWQDCLIYQQQLKQYNELLNSMLTARNNIDDDGCRINVTAIDYISRSNINHFELPYLKKKLKEAKELKEALNRTCEPLSTNIFEIGTPLRAGPKLDASAEYVKPYSNNVLNTEFQGNGTITDYCNFMTLDLQCDKHAHAALHAYSVSCSEDDPELSERLAAKAAEMSLQTLNPHD